ncbi:ER-bound oxygenase mpaB/mpaB'/Rubber oxygenase catalytic domain-containing protein [Sphingomonas antarctica]|uniref:oxygenase MpaB family protein n=1 Tax=Sphingomonas antarctica TaxID=2040274 RepID=UPI0039EA70FC
MPAFSKNYVRSLQLKSFLIGRVRATFHDQSRGEGSLERSQDALFPPDSAIWRVHGDVMSMMIGGVASLFMQMLHPAVLAGVWDHSNFREDTLGRLRRTARFIAVTTYGQRDAAEASIARVRRIHDKISGTLPDGTAYRAVDPAALAWVHATESLCFLEAWLRYGDPAMPLAERDAYFVQAGRVGRALGADPVPETHAAARLYVEQQRPHLRADDRSREVARFLIERPASRPSLAPVQAMAFAAAIDLLPPWARDTHGFANPAITRPLVRASATGFAKTLRWAFA